MKIIYVQEMEIFYIDLEKGNQGSEIIHKYIHIHTKIGKTIERLP